MPLRSTCFGSFDQTVKTYFGFARADEIEHVPEVPGVYAWYIPLRGDDSGSLLEFLADLHNTLKDYVPLTALGAESAQRVISIERHAPNFAPTETEETLSQQLANESVQAIAQLMLAMSFLAEPVYVGMTRQKGGLRARLKSHLQNPRTLFDDDQGWTGSFRSRAAEALGRPDGLSGCLVAYISLPRSETLRDERVIRLLERHLIRFIRPAQNRKS
jgi:hypothetical protein